MDNEEEAMRDAGVAWGEKPTAARTIDPGTATIDDVPIEERCLSEVPHNEHYVEFRGGDLYGGYTCDGRMGLVRVSPEEMTAQRRRERRERLAADVATRLTARVLGRPATRRLIAVVTTRLLRTYAADALDDVAGAIEAQRRDTERQMRAARRDGAVNTQTYHETVGAGLDTATAYLRQIESTLRGPNRG